MGKQWSDLGEIPKDEWPINDSDWFKLSRSWIIGHEERLKAQVSTLQETIKWFFTITSSATIISSVIKTPQIKAGSIGLLLISLTSLLLSYSVSTLAVTLITKSLKNPNSPSNIRGVFNRSNKKSKQLLVLASVLLVVGMCLFPIAVMMSFQEESKVKIARSSTFVAHPVIEPDTMKKELRFITGLEISGTLADSSIVRLKLEKGKDGFNTIVLDSFSHPLSHPQFDFSIRLKKSIAIDSGEYYFVTMFEKTRMRIKGEMVRLDIPKD